MRFRINANKIARGLGLATTAVSLKQVASPVLKNTRLEARSGRVEFAMTDLIVSAQFDTEAEVLEEGSCLVDGEDFLAIAKAGKKENLEFTQKNERGEDSRAQIFRGESEFQLPVANPEMFPSLKSRTEGRVELPVSLFNYLLERTMYAAQYTEGDGARTDSVHFEMDGRNLVAVATDGLRVAIASCPWGESFPEITVPKRACEALFALTRGIIESAEDDGAPAPTVRIDDLEESLSFQFDRLFIHAQKAVTTYFPWRTLIERRDRMPLVEVAPEDLRRAISDLVIIRGEAVLITAERDRINFREQTSHGKSARTSIHCSGLDGRRLETAINGKHVLAYLDPVCRMASTSPLKLRISDTRGMPIFFEHTEGERKAEYVSMPINLED